MFQPNIQPLLLVQNRKASKARFIIVFSHVCGLHKDLLPLKMKNKKTKATSKAVLHQLFSTWDLYIFHWQWHFTLLQENLSIFKNCECHAWNGVQKFKHFWKMQTSPFRIRSAFAFFHKCYNIWAPLHTRRSQLLEILWLSFISVMDILHKVPIDQNKVLKSRHIVLSNLSSPTWTKIIECCQLCLLHFQPSLKLPHHQNFAQQ